MRACREHAQSWACAWEPQGGESSVTEAEVAPPAAPPTGPEWSLCL